MTRKPTKRLSRETWLEIQGRYERGDSTADMSREYGVNRSAIANQAKRHGWASHGSLKEQAVEAARKDIIKEWGDAYAEKLKTARTRHENLFKNIQLLGGAMLAQINLNLGDDKSKHKELGRSVANLSAVASAIKLGVDGERLTLEMDRVSGRPQEEDGFTALAKQFEQMRQEGAFDGMFDFAQEQEGDAP